MVNYEIVSKHPPAQIVGHRGIPTLAPENTIIGFQIAKKMGVEWVECDVSLLQDNVAILMHDKTFQRTTNGNGFLADHRIEDVKSLDAGSWFSHKFSGEQIPTLQLAMETFSKIDLGVNIEMKVHKDEGPQLAKVVSQILEGMSLIMSNSFNQKILVSSFDFGAISMFHKLNPNIPTAILSRNFVPELIEMAETIDGDTLIIDQRHLDRATIQLLRNNNFKIGCYTVNEINRSVELMNAGVDWIISDIPHLLK